jgi:hypothetical protein
MYGRGLAWNIFPSCCNTEKGRDLRHDLPTNYQTIPYCVTAFRVSVNGLLLVP